MQLRAQQALRNALVEFEEQTIQFAPTYKYKIGLCVWVIGSVGDSTYRTVAVLFVAKLATFYFPKSHFYQVFLESSSTLKRVLKENRHLIVIVFFLCIIL